MGAEKEPVPPSSCQLGKVVPGQITVQGSPAAPEKAQGLVPKGHSNYTQTFNAVGEP